MEGISGSDIKEVAVPVPVNILGLVNGPFEEGAVPQSVRAAIQLQGALVEGLYLFCRQKDGIVAHRASLRKSSGCSAKTSSAAALAALLSA